MENIKTIISCFLILITTSFSLKAQSNTTDSLYNSLKNCKVDTQKITLLIAICDELRKTDPDSSFVFARQAYDLYSEKIPNSLKSEILENMSYHFYLTYEYDSALHYSNLAEGFIKYVNDSIFVSYYYRSRSIMFRCVKNYPFATENGLKAYQLSKEMKDTSGMISSLRHIALSLDHSGNLDSSLYYSFKALDHINRDEKSGSVAKIYFTIATTYARHKNFEKAIEYMRLSSNAFPENEKGRFINKINNNLGVFYKNLDSLHKANFYFKKVLDNATQKNNQNKIAQAKLQIGNIYRMQKQYINAETELVQSIKILEKGNNDWLKNHANQKLALLYTDMKLYDKALQLLKIVHINAANSFNASEIRDVKELMVEAYSNVGDYKNALEMHKAFKALSDSLFYNEKAQEVTKLEMSYLFNKEKKEIEHENLIKIKEKENVISKERNVRNISIGLLLFLTLLGLLLFIIIRAKQKLKEQKLQDKLFLYMQKTLSQQMNPHFFFNTLTTIQNYIYTKNKESSVEYVSKFANLMRQTLNNYQHHFILLSQELSLTKLFADFEKTNSETKFSYNVNINPEVNPDNYKVPSFIIQPLVENSIKHGLKNIYYQGIIDVNVYKVSDSLIIEVVDNGLGMENSKKKHPVRKHKSMATDITNKRLSLLSEYYKKDLSIEYFDVADTKKGSLGTKAKMTLPVIV